MKKILAKIAINTPLIGSYAKSRFTAGETFEEALIKLKKLQEQGLKTTIAYLGGEHISDKNDILRAIKVHNHMLNELPPNCDIAIKLSQFGLFLPDQSKNHLHWLNNFTEEARRKNIFIWIDAEELEFRERVLEIIFYLTHENLGICIQAYAQDALIFINKLIDLNIAVRICKGAYNEDPKEVFKDKDRIQGSFYQLLLSASRARLPKIQNATHDEYLQFVTQKVYPIKEYLKKGCIEFGVLLGRHESPAITSLINNGYTVNVYTPFGPDWKDFIERRIKEKPDYLLLPFKK